MKRVYAKSAILLLFGLAAAPAAESKYAKPDLLIEAAVLADPVKAKDFVVLDVRAAKKYEAGRIPHARWVDHAAWVKAFGSGQDVDGWSKRLGALGITLDSRVVLYDDTGTKDAAQIWWIARYWGVKDVRLLNGGWNAWKAGNHSVQTNEVPAIKPVAVAVTAKPNPARLATKDFVLGSLKDGSQQLVDARSEGEITGSEKLARRGGTIPGSKHLEWTELLDTKTGRFKSADELNKLFKDAGVDLSKPVTAYCQSGRRSSVTAFALELLGHEQARNYFASWFEWGNLDDTPVVPGKVK